MWIDFILAWGWFYIAMRDFMKGDFTWGTVEVAVSFLYACAALYRMITSHAVAVAQEKTIEA